MSYVFEILGTGLRGVCVEEVKTHPHDNKHMF